MYKNIRIPKRGGGTRLQRVQVLKSGKYKFVKNLSKSRPAKRPAKTKSTKRRSYTTAKRKGRRRRKFTIPLAPVAGLFAGLAAGPNSPVEFVMKGDFNEAALALCARYTGYHARDQNWDPRRMSAGLLPLVIGGLVHKFVGGPPLNLNKMLAAANVPFIRI